MDCVILFRNPSSGGIGFISKENGEDIEVFKNRDDAIDFALEHFLLRAFPYQVVELDEL